MHHGGMMLVDHVTRQLTPSEQRVLPMGSEETARPYRRRYVCQRIAQAELCYSIGTRNPFQNHRTPIWLRFHKATGHFDEIAGRIERSELLSEAVHSEGHLWFPLEVPLNSDRETMIRSLVEQAQRIAAEAYPTDISEQIHFVTTEGFPEDIRAFLDREHWTFAKTMPTWPHEYLVRERVDDALFEATVVHIRTRGYEGRFYQRPITYFDEDGWIYWTMGAPIAETIIINRCRKEDTYEARKNAGTLPK